MAGPIYDQSEWGAWSLPSIRERVALANAPSQFESMQPNLNDIGGVPAAQYWGDILKEMEQEGKQYSFQLNRFGNRPYPIHNGPKTLGDLVVDTVTHPAVLTLAGGLYGVAGGAAGAAGGAGSGGGTAAGAGSGASGAGAGGAAAYEGLGGLTIGGGAAGGTAAGAGTAAGGTAAGTGAVGGSAALGSGITSSAPAVTGSAGMGSAIGTGITSPALSASSTGGVLGMSDMSGWASAIGALIGAIDSNNQPKSTTSTQTSDPWAGLQPYLRDLFARSQGASINPSAATAQSQRMISDRANAGSPLTGAAQSALLPTLRGDYLDPGTNPAWAPMSQRITDAYSQGTAAQTDAAFNRAGAFGLGNSAYEQQVGRNQQGLGDALSMLAGNIYNQERGRQMQGINIAPFTAQSQYADAERLGQLGQEQTWGPLFNYQRLISGQGGGTTNMSQPLYSNPLNGALGGALLGNQLYQGFGNQDQSSGNQFANWMDMGSSTPFSGGYGWGNV